MTDHPHDMSFELGGIKQQLETIMRTLSENRTADAQYRTNVNAQMTTQSDAINAVKTDLSIAKADISEMKPTVKGLAERALMSKGAANLAIVLGKFAHVLSAAIGGIIAVLIDKWLHGK